MIQKPSILCVEDEPESRLVFERMVADHYTVFHAATIDQALAVLASQAIAVVVADERLREGSGSDLLAMVRRDYPDVVRMLATGFADLDSVIAAVNKGHIYHYFRKPLVAEEVLRVIDKSIRFVDERQQLSLTMHGVERALHGVLQVDMEGRFIYANQAACSTLGYTQQELESLYLFDVDTGVGSAKFADHFSRVRTLGTTGDETKLRRRDGSLLPVYLIATHVRSGRHELLQCTAIDLSEQKAAEQEVLRLNEELEHRVRKRTADLEEALAALHQRERELERAQEVAHLGSYWLDLTTGETRLSVGLKQLLGVSDMGEDAPQLQDMILPEDRSQLLESNQEIMETAGGTFCQSYRVRRPDGEVRYFEDRAEVDRDEQGRPVALVGTLHDVTKASQAEKEREQLLRSMGARVKELNCLLDVSRAGQENATLGETLTRAVRAIPAAWQYPEITSARVTVDGQDFLSPGFENSPWQLTSPIVVGEEIRGEVVVIYEEERPLADEGPFLAEHRYLLDGIAGIISQMLERHDIQRARKESEQRYRVLFERSPDGILIMDVTTLRFVFANPAICQLVGKRDDELIGMRLLDIHPEEAHEGLLDLFKNASPGEPQLTVEVPCNTASGELVYTDVSSSIITMQGKKYALCVYRDTTARKEAEDALRAEMDLVEQLVNSMPGIFYLFDDGGQLVRWNVNLARLTGLSQEQLAGASVLDLIVDEDLPQAAAAIQTALETGRAEAELRLNDATGSEAIYFFTGARLDLDGRQMIIGTGSDVSSRAAMEAEMRRLSLAVEQSPASVAITDAEGTIEYVNPKFSEMTGYSAEDIVGTNPRYQGATAEPAGLYRALWRSVQVGKEWRGEFCNRRKGGARYWERAFIAPIKDQYGRINHFVAVTEDVTREKAVKEELRRAKEEAESASQAKSSFLANMSHEIRTPMNAILGFSQLMLRDEQLTPEQQKNLRTIMRSGEHLLDLINDVLEMSKIEAGRIDAKVAPFDLRRMLVALEEMLRARTERSGLSFDVEVAAGVPRWITTDQGKLRQIMVNLLSNAVKFTTVGGITVRVSAFRAGEQWRLRLEVEDTGVGIAPEDIAKVFEQFEQTKSGMEQVEGTGLGLAISRSYARLLGGDLTAESWEGKGSVFRCEVLVEESESMGAEAENTENLTVRLATGENPLQVLVVDDVADNRHVLSLNLKNAGFQVEEAVGGAEALDHVLINSPRVVLMDLQMPGMNGFEAIRHMRSLPGGDHVWVIAVTASAFDVDRRKALDSGADAFVRKPVHMPELLGEISRGTGAQLEYVDESQTRCDDVDTDHGDELTANNLESLPDELLEMLRSATVKGDLDQLIELLDDTARHDPRIAGGLRRLADRFDYEGLGLLLGV